jgi:hypothetical protein
MSTGPDRSLRPQRLRKQLLRVVACILVSAAAGCLPPQPQAQVNEEDMAATRELLQKITIPKLDAAVPVLTETATFALG